MGNQRPVVTLAQSLRWVLGYNCSGSCGRTVSRDITNNGERTLQTNKLATSHRAETPWRKRSNERKRIEARAWHAAAASGALLHRTLRLLYYELGKLPPPEPCCTVLCGYCMLLS